MKVLNLIAKELRQKLPFTEATKVGDSDVVNLLDAFMYEQEDLEELRLQKKLRLYYCHDCQSKNIEPISMNFTYFKYTNDFFYYLNFQLLINFFQILSRNLYQGKSCTKYLTIIYQLLMGKSFWISPQDSVQLCTV